MACKHTVIIFSTEPVYPLKNDCNRHFVNFYQALIPTSLVPRPPPSFPSLAVRFIAVYHTASDGKLGGGLGTRLNPYSTVVTHSPVPLRFRK